MNSERKEPVLRETEAPNGAQASAEPSAPWPLPKPVAPGIRAGGTAGAPASVAAGPGLRDVLALTVGASVGLVVAVLCAVVWWSVDSASIGGALLSLILWGVPLAVLTLIVCGAITRRFRVYLVVVGALLFASPWIGFGLESVLG